MKLRYDRDAVKALLGYPYPVNLENKKECISSLYSSYEQKQIYMAIVEKDQNKLAGYITAKNINLIHQNAEFGIILAKEFRGKGLAKEATALFMSYLFNDIHLNKVSLTALEENTAAIRMYESLGFKHEGCLKRHIWQDGSFKNLLIFSLFSDEFTWVNTK